MISDDLLHEMEAFRRPSAESTRERSPLGRRIDNANTAPIHLVLRDEFEILVPEEIDKSWKIHCPFGAQHLDGGLEKNTRVYDNGYVYCFASLDHGRMGPVDLVQNKYSWPLPRVLEYLEDRYDLRRYEHDRDRMARLMVERERAVHPAGDPADAVAALTASLRGVPGYVDRQYDEPILRSFQQQVELLGDAIAGPEGSVLRWLTDAKVAVVKVLEGDTDG